MIRSSDPTAHIECAILDISEGGACVLLPGGATIRDTFDPRSTPTAKATPVR